MRRPHQQTVINVTGVLTKSVDLERFDQGGNDIIYGGTGNDWLHGGKERRRHFRCRL
jgi:Ca2+-binding RTX toxin-like protein